MCYDERRTESQIKTSKLLKIFTKNDYTTLKSQLELLRHYDVMELKKRYKEHCHSCLDNIKGYNRT